MQNKANLLDDRMNVSRVLTKDYENNNAFRPMKTKPIQSQTNPIFTSFSDRLARLMREFPYFACAFDVTPAVLFPRVWSPMSSRRVAVESIGLDADLH